MTRAPSCWKHPAQSQIGVCAACLRDRLKQLCIEEQYSSPRCSFDCNSNSSAAAAAVAPPVLGLGENVAALLAADRAAEESAADRNADESLTKFATFLQRTHSWSGSRHQNQNPQQQQQQQRMDLGKMKNFGGVCGGLQSLPPSGALIYDEKLDLYDTPKRHYKASSWPEIDQPHKPQQEHHRMSSWIASLFGFRGRGKDLRDAKERKRFFGLGRKKLKPGSSAAASAMAAENITASPWRFKGDFEEFQSGSGSNKVMPVGEFGEKPPAVTRVRSVNGRPQQPKAPSWSAPFRKVGARKSGRNETDDGDGLDQTEENASSPVASAEVKRFYPSPAFPTNSSYTAYYRDYGGSSWSLHSSPMPGKSRWSGGNHHGHLQQQQQVRKDGFHLHPSPFHHATGSNTWNFYLTPLRPVRSSVASSRHRS